MGVISGVCTSTGGSSPGVTVWGCNLRGYSPRTPLNYEIGDSMLMTRSLHRSGDVRSGFDSATVVLSQRGYTAKLMFGFPKCVKAPIYCYVQDSMIRCDTKLVRNEERRPISWQTFRRRSCLSSYHDHVLT